MKDAGIGSEASSPLDFAAILDAVEDGVAVFDAGGAVRYHNPGWSSCSAAFIAREHSDGAPSAAARELAAAVSAVTTGEQAPRELTLESWQAGDGPPAPDARVAVFTLTPIEHGGARCALVCCREVTEAKRREAQILAEAEHDRFFFAHAAVMAHSIDAQGFLVDVNSTWLDKLGYQREEVIGRRSTDFLTEASKKYAREVVLPQFFKTGRCDNVSYQFVRKDGSTLDILLSATSKRTKDGKVLFSVATLFDVTDRLRAEEALSKSEERYRRIIETTREGVWLFDPELKTLFANPRMASLLGRHAEEMLGRSPVELIADTDESASLTATLKVERDALREGQEVRLTRGDGSPLWTTVTTNAILDEAGSVVGYLAMLSDITQRKLAEKEQERLRIELSVQGEEIRVLSTPVIPITDRVLVMPLIGTIDQKRAQMVMESLLSSLSAKGSEAVILDITGVSVVNTHVASALVRTAQAARLLGAEVILTGIKPEVAKALVELGAELDQIRTLGTLQSAVAYALRGRGGARLART